MLHPLPLPLSSCLGCIPPLIGLPSLRFYAVGSSLFLLSVCFCLCSLFYRDDVLCWLLLARPFLYAFHAHLRFPVDLVWFRLSCDHGWIRSGSVNVRKQQQQQQQIHKTRRSKAILPYQIVLARPSMYAPVKKHPAVRFRVREGEVLRIQSANLWESSVLLHADRRKGMAWAAQTLLSFQCRAKFYFSPSEQGGVCCQISFVLSFSCSADHGRDWPPCQVVFSGWQPIR